MIPASVLFWGIEISGEPGDPMTSFLHMVWPWFSLQPCQRAQLELPGPQGPNLSNCSLFQQETASLSLLWSIGFFSHFYITQGDFWKTKYKRYYSKLMPHSSLKQCHTTSCFTLLLLLEWEERKWKQKYEKSKHNLILQKLFSSFITFFMPQILATNLYYLCNQNAIILKF